jgi:23S rRNA pseudouridine2605 synthase
VGAASVRLNAWLARAGVASRRGADELIKAGRVSVDGQPGQLNTFVSAGAEVALDGTPLRSQRLAYIVLHKPTGVVTSLRDPEGRPTVVQLVTHPSRVVPVGRLDLNTTGVLVLTNDGALAHRLAHPRYGVDKVYEARLAADPTASQLARLESGVELDDGLTAPAQARRLGRRRVELIVHEGRKHQVRRMLEAVGLPVTALHRSRYGGLSLDGLEPGAWRELSPAELERLRSAPRASRPPATRRR